MILIFLDLYIPTSYVDVNHRHTHWNAETIIGGKRIQKHNTLRTYFCHFLFPVSSHLFSPYLFNCWQRKVMPGNYIEFVQNSAIIRLFYFNMEIGQEIYLANCPYLSSKGTVYFKNIFPGLIFVVKLVKRFPLQIVPKSYIQRAQLELQNHS